MGKNGPQYFINCNKNNLPQTQEPWDHLLKPVLLGGEGNYFPQGTVVAQAEAGSGQLTAHSNALTWWGTLVMPNLQSLGRLFAQEGDFTLLLWDRLPVALFLSVWRPGNFSACSVLRGLWEQVLPIWLQVELEVRFWEDSVDSNGSGNPLMFHLLIFKKRSHWISYRCHLYPFSCPPSLNYN
jgi:hypothetical protein